MPGMWLAGRSPADIEFCELLDSLLELLFYLTVDMEQG